MVTVSGLSALPQSLHVIDDEARGLRGIIAIDSLAIGPAIGGCRLGAYADLGALAADATRLARAMTYKTALAGLPFGGGAAVLQLPEGRHDRADLFRGFAAAVDGLGGRYLATLDAGVEGADMAAAASPYLTGRTVKGGRPGGDPAAWTALGVVNAMKAAAKVAFDRPLGELTVALQGAGHVGSRLSLLLAKAGARLVIADSDPARAARIADATGARIVAADEILSVEADVLAPCALGPGIDADAVAMLGARLICGGANNQLGTGAVADRLLARGIVYAPDYAAGAGGMINAAAEALGWGQDEVIRRVQAIGPRVEAILTAAARERVSPVAVADRMVEETIGAAHVMRRMAA